MKITMIDYTGFGQTYPDQHAEDILFFAKNTRLMRSSGFEEIRRMTGEERVREISYIARTIPSCWEFLHYTFVIEKVTRAFTHQLVRTRVASFAQQTMRVLPMENFEWGTSDSLEGQARTSYHQTMHQINKKYTDLLNAGAKPEDARGILPTNILTNITMSANLRTIVELVRKRSGPRVQGEYRKFIEILQAAVQDVHPFTEQFFGLDWTMLNQELAKETEFLSLAHRTRIAKLFSKVTEGVSS